MSDLGTEYIQTRRRELQKLRRRAKAMAQRADREFDKQILLGDIASITAARDVLVRCKANLFIAEAFCETLESIR